MTNAWDPSPGASHLALAQPASSSARIVIHNQIRPLASPLRVSPSRTRDRLSLETHHHPSRTVSLPLHSPHIFHHLPQSFFMWLFAKWHSDSKVYSYSHDTMQSKECCYCYWTLDQLSKTTSDASLCLAENTALKLGGIGRLFDHEGVQGGHCLQLIACHKVFFILVIPGIN